MVQTYRYFRVGVIVMFGGLAFSILFESLRTECVQDSISAYYYTPARAIFVGTLIAIAFALISILGNTPRQDLSLNIAGLTAPGIALVPAAFPATGHNRCGSVDLAFKSEGVTNNGLAYLLMLLIAGIAVGVVTRRSSRSKPEQRDKGEETMSTIRSRNLRLGFLVSWGMGLAGTLWFFLDRDSFEDHGHLASGGVMFVSISVTAILAASTSSGKTRFGYWIVVGLIASGPIVGGALLLFGDPTWLLWMEVMMLVGFAGFWAIQTVESWNEEKAPRTDSLRRGSPEGLGSPGAVRSPGLTRWLQDESRWPVGQ